jgi:hypothetical protein
MHRARICLFAFNNFLVRSFYIRPACPYGHAVNGPPLRGIIVAFFQAGAVLLRGAYQGNDAYFYSGRVTHGMFAKKKVSINSSQNRHRNFAGNSMVLLLHVASSGGFFF